MRRSGRVSLGDRKRTQVASSGFRCKRAHSPAQSVPLATVAPVPNPETDTSALSARDLEILAFERQWFRFPAAKETIILDRFAMTATRYYAVLNHLIDHPAALEAEPQVVNRLRRIRDARRDQRTRTRR
jgi:hypothetical protein